MRQRLLVALQRSMTQTMAAIAASRLAAMQVAERDVADRLERLHREHHGLRQAQITEELLDIVSRFDFLRGLVLDGGVRLVARLAHRSLLCLQLGLEEMPTTAGHGLSGSRFKASEGGPVSVVVLLDDLVRPPPVEHVETHQISS